MATYATVFNPLNMETSRTTCCTFLYMMFYVIQDGLTLYGKTYFHAPPELGSKLAVPAATNRGFLFIMSYHEMGKRDRLFADVFI